MMIGYKRPDQTHRDDVVFDILQTILSGGRTGLLQKELVQEKAVAQVAAAQATFPAGRFPCLFLFVLSPKQGHTLEESRKALDELLIRFEAKPVDAVTLARAKAQARVAALRRLGSNPELAAILPAYYAGYGDWRQLFSELDELDKVKAEDVQRVALRYFNPVNRTMAYTPQQGRPDTVQDGVGGPQ
jgi:predicted Zn-dependent peptidase